MNLPGFDAATIERLSDRDEYAQGRTYFEDGRVRNLVLAEGVYKAYVHRIGHYIVRISPTDGDPGASCSCPYEGKGFCRHIVAVALTVLKGAPNEGFVLVGHDLPVQEGLHAALMREWAGRDASGQPQPSFDAAPQPLRGLCARDVMVSPVRTLSESADLAEAWRFITECRFRHLPVVRDGRLVGIISDRDLLREAVRKAMDSRSATRRVADMMHSPVLTARPDTDIRQVARVMFEEHVGSIPILDAQGTLAGMITRSDILKALVERM